MFYPNETTSRRASALDDARTIWREVGPTSVCEPSSRFDFNLATPTLLIRPTTAAAPGTHVVAYVAPYAAPSLFTAQTPLTPAAMLNDIREAFGLNMTQLAQVMQSERITVYAWLRDDDIEKMREGKRQRLQQLHHIARMWHSYEPLAGRYLLEKLPGIGGQSVLELLCADVLDPPVFAAVYEQLARSTAPTVRAQRHRAEQKALLNKATDNLVEHLDQQGMDLR